MARIRSIKPGFFRSEDVSALPLRARLTWIGLWTHCDDAGRTKDNLKLIKADVWPLDNVSLRDIEEDLETLAAHGRIVRYEVDGRRYLAIVNWGYHQSIQKPTPSRLPAPPPSIAADSGSATGGVPDGSATPTGRKGREGRGREGTRAPAREAPPERCPKHTDTPDPPPCGPCADARRARAAWEREQAAAAAVERSAGALDRAAAARAAIDACDLCDGNGYVGTVLCAHDPTGPARAVAGAAAARAALTADPGR